MRGIRWLIAYLKGINFQLSELNKSQKLSPSPFMVQSCKSVDFMISRYSDWPLKWLFTSAYCSVGVYRREFEQSWRPLL